LLQRRWGRNRGRRRWGFGLGFASVLPRHGGWSEAASGIWGMERLLDELVIYQSDV
jgi:hypothetical protein